MYSDQYHYQSPVAVFRVLLQRLRQTEQPLKQSRTETGGERTVTETVVPEFSDRDWGRKKREKMVTESCSIRVLSQRIGVKETVTEAVVSDFSDGDCGRKNSNGSCSIRVKTENGDEKTVTEVSLTDCGRKNSH